MKTIKYSSKIKHIAIIMDGNGRWAKAQGKTRSYGHKKGANTLKKITIHCAKAKIKYLSLYAFSTENWARSKSEVSFLMKLLYKFLTSQEELFIQNDICFKAIGDISKLSDKLQKQIAHLQDITKNNKGLTQLLALNYGAKDEIIRAIKRLNHKKIKLNEKNIEDNLDTGFKKGAKKVDILIRTGGEKRLSNFLLWQCAYAELFFTKTMWPEFSTKELDKILKKFSKRERRFGKEC